jgi:hypothetical protein
VLRHQKLANPVPTLDGFWQTLYVHLHQALPSKGFPLVPIRTSPMQNFWMGYAQVGSLHWI